jgi:hypothetical protein
MDFTGRRKSSHPKRILAGGGGGGVPLEPIVEMRVGLTSQLHGGNYQLFNLLPPAAAMGANHLQHDIGSQHPEPIITITKVWFLPVLRIHEILARIRIRKSISLTNGCGSGSCYFRQ